MERDKLLEQIAENFVSVFRSMADRTEHHPLGKLPYGQKAALFWIARNKKSNVKQLASCLQITSGAVTQHVEALFTEGYVERLTDPEDRRNVVIVLTPKGETLIQKLLELRHTKMTELFKDTSHEELQTFNAVLEKINNKLRSKA